MEVELASEAGGVLESEMDEELTWRSLLGSLTRRQDITRRATRWAITQTVTGQVDALHLAAFLAALTTKGETVDELEGVVQALLDAAQPYPFSSPSYDIAGTGGDGTGAMNISTLAAVVAAGCGCTVVKHGGRAASSATAGSADLVEALGIDWTAHAEPPAAGTAPRPFTYLFAPLFNPGLRHAIEARRALGIPTAFNLAAPLINPARPDRQLIGVARADRVQTIAATMRRLGRRGLVVRGSDGLDKLTTTGPNEVVVVGPDGLQHSTLDAAELGIRRATVSEFRGGTARENARQAQSVLEGARGALRDIVVLNTAALITAGELRSDSMVAQLRHGVERAEEAIDSGRALAVLERQPNGERE